MKFSDSLQNLMQYRGPIGALWGKKFQLDSKRFGRYRFPGVGQFFDSRTVPVLKPYLNDGELIITVSTVGQKKYQI